MLINFFTSFQNVLSRGGDTSAGTIAIAARQSAIPSTDPASVRPDTREETAKKVKRQFIRNICKVKIIRTLLFLLKVFEEKRSKLVEFSYLLNLFSY